MFTGIVETTGRVAAIDADEGGRRLEIAAPSIAGELLPGDSVSVDGACLTVEAAADESFSVFLATETVERTALSSRSIDDRLNLERAMPASGRFDGHLVQGHVDTTTTMESLEREGEDWWASFALPQGFAQYIVEKGSITIDGISLTIADCDEETFTIAIVPTTYERTTIGDRNPGDHVHIEVDVIAKYVESLLSHRAD